MNSDEKEGNCDMDMKGKPKIIEVSISKQSMDSKDSDPRMKAKKELLSQIKSMAVNSMKDSIFGSDKEMDDEMDKAPGSSHKKSEDEDKEEEMEESKEEEVSMLPEDFDKSKEEKLAALMEEMEELKERIKQLMD